MPRRLPQPALTLSLQWADSRHREQVPRHRVSGWIRAALRRPAQITVRVVGCGEGRRLNREFRGKDKATNVLTFDYSLDPMVVADLVLCADVVEQEARAAGRPLTAHYAHLIVHGVLHAQGMDHVDAAQAATMEALESRILCDLGFDDPWMAPRETTQKKRPGASRGGKASTLSGEEAPAQGGKAGESSLAATIRRSI